MNKPLTQITSQSLEHSALDYVSPNLDQIRNQDRIYAPRRNIIPNAPDMNISSK